MDGGVPLCPVVRRRQWMVGLPREARCPNGHQLGAGQVLVGHQACRLQRRRRGGRRVRGHPRTRLSDRFSVVAGCGHQPQLHHAEHSRKWRPGGVWSGPVGGACDGPVGPVAGCWGGPCCGVVTWKPLCDKDSWVPDAHAYGHPRRSSRRAGRCAGRPTGRRPTGCTGPGPIRWNAVSAAP